MATRGARMVALLLLLAPACDGRATPLRARGRPPRAGALTRTGGGPPPPPRLSLRQHALAGAFAPVRHAAPEGNGHTYPSSDAALRTAARRTALDLIYQTPSYVA